MKNDDLVWRKSSLSSMNACVEVGEHDWKKSSCSSSINCVEIANKGDHLHVRDSKDRNGPQLVFTRDEWTAFTGGVRNGEFDY